MIQKSNTNKLISLLIITLLSISVKTQCPDGSQCVECLVSSCKICTKDINFCDTCNDGYFQETNSSCVECPTKCLSCTNLQQCDQCTPGYDTTFDENGYQVCVFYWWKWFLIIFGTILGLALIFLLIYYIRKKLKEEDSKNKEIEYQMKLETTEPNIN